MKTIHLALVGEDLAPDTRDDPGTPSVQKSQEKGRREAVARRASRAPRGTPRGSRGVRNDAAGLPPSRDREESQASPGKVA